MQVEDNIAADEFIAAASEQRIVAFGMGATVLVVLFNDGCCSCPHVVAFRLHASLTCCVKSMRCIGTHAVS